MAVHLPGSPFNASVPLRKRAMDLARRKLRGDAFGDAKSFIWAARRTPESVYNLMDRLNTKPDLPQPEQAQPLKRTTVLSPDLIRRLRRERRENGTSYSMLAKKYGIGYSTAHRYCNQPERKTDGDPAPEG